MKTGTVITVFMDIWLLTAVVRAETISGRWEKVEALSPGTAVIVKLQGGERLEGTFKSTGPDEIVFVESGGMERRFPRIAVLRIETASVVPDRLCNGALLREHHLIEDTTGKRCDLFYLRDKEKNEVDFLTVVDGKPDLMVEEVGPGRFLQSLNGSDVGVIQRGQQFGFALEPGDAIRVSGEFLRQHLDGDVPAEFAILRPVNLAL